ncbi:MAG: FkbM family methyltransferase [Planctomycetes bacterium]|nr:FkbM family methyltransferase [Planctomycetota bacterium]
MKSLDFLQIVIGDRCKKLEKWDPQSDRRAIQGMGRFFPLRKILPKTLKSLLRLYAVIRNKKIYFVNALEKRFAHEFLLYCLKYNPEIPYDFFCESDCGELDFFLRNKFLAGLCDYLEEDDIFGSKALQTRLRYKTEISNHLRRKKSNYFWDEFQFPYFFIENNVFMEKYGIGELKNVDKIRGSTILDCGAFFGDSTWLFATHFQPDRIIAFEPDPISFQLLRKCSELNKPAFHNVELMNCGVFDTHKEVSLSLLGTGGAYVADEGMVRVECRSIDEIAESLSVSRIGLIKMDIEGSELPAIRGAQKVIIRDKPTLLISMYHKPEDFFEIPTLLKKLVPQYQFRFLNLDAEKLFFERILLAEVV